jgi:hypothetical protein
MLLLVVAKALAQVLCLHAPLFLAKSEQNSGTCL